MLNLCFRVHVRFLQLTVLVVMKKKKEILPIIHTTQMEKLLSIST